VSFGRGGNDEIGAFDHRRSCRFREMGNG